MCNQFYNTRLEKGIEYAIDEQNKAEAAETEATAVVGVVVAAKGEKKNMSKSSGKSSSVDKPVKEGEGNTVLVF